MTGIDLGCGANKKEGYIGLDILQHPNVDIVMDLTREPLPFEDASVDEVYSSHFFEHITDPKFLLHEMVRVAVPNGKCEIWTPYLKSNDAFVLNHYCFYSETIWKHICTYFPDYWFEGIQAALRLERIHFVLTPNIEEELTRLRIPLDFAIEHMFNIANEFGVFMTVLKGPQAKEEAKNHIPQITFSHSRTGPAKALKRSPREITDVLFHKLVKRWNPVRLFERICSVGNNAIMGRIIKLIKLLLNPKRLWNKTRKAIDYTKHYGFAMLVKRVLGLDGYEQWRVKNEPSLPELSIQKSHQFEYRPKISIITPTYNTPIRILKAALDSVINQTYSNWEVCIADGSSDGFRKKILPCLKHYSKISDGKIRFKLLDRNYGIAGNTNQALELAEGEYIAFFDHDDLLAPFALHEVVKVLNTIGRIDLIYSDEDKMSSNSCKRYDPFFKPDWSPNTLQSYNYITHFLVIGKDLLDRIGRLREGYDGSQDYDLILRATEQADQIVHIPKVLYHWRALPTSAAFDLSVKSYAVDAAKKALKDHWERLGVNTEVVDGLFYGSYRPRVQLQQNPKISMVIPNKNSHRILRQCIESIFEKSSYSNFEVIVVDNGSSESETFDLYKELQEKHQIRVLEWNAPFNYSAINNFAVNFCEGEHVLFLNNDTEVISAHWLEEMLFYCVQSELGVVGSKLYYPDDKLQHAGVIVGMGGVAGHPYHGFPKTIEGYMYRNKIVQNLSAVTGACMMMRKKVFLEVGGFDERLAVAYNDVDLCLKIRNKGYFIVWTPYAELYHYESLTRGPYDNLEKLKSLEEETALFKSKWKDILENGDPFASPNFNLNVWDFSIKTD